MIKRNKKKGLEVLFSIFASLIFFSVNSWAENIEVTTAYQIGSLVIPEERWEEGNKEINLAKKLHPELPSLIYIYFKNESKEPISIKDIVWENLNLEKRFKDYSLIWWRLLPEALAPGKEGEISICLRKEIEKPTEFTIIFSDDSKHNCLVSPDAPPFRIQTINFGEDLRKIYLYIEGSVFSSPLPKKVYLDGEEITRKVHWLSNDYVKNLRVCIVNLSSPLKRGSLHTFRVTSDNEKVSCATTLRAFSKLAVFGTYGGDDFKRYAQNGLSAYNCFGIVGELGLNRANEFGIKCIMTVNEKEPPEGTIGHSSLYAYMLRDEPDCADYGADENRPMHFRLGTLAPSMVNASSLCFNKDQITPTMITINLTFTPGNYFVYGPIADLSNPDCYPITVGWSILKFLQHALIVKTATAPKPFTFTYQGCWERAGIPQDRWVSGKELREKGFETFVDKKKVRGFGRKIVPAEIRIEMLYAIAAGAKGLFSFIDDSEAGGDIVFYGTDVLPENWKEIGRTSRALTMVAPLIDIGHPFDWAKSSSEFVRTSTLLCGEKAALVVVVNENYTCNNIGFFQKPLKNVIVFPDLPWLRAAKVVKVEDKKFTPLEYKRNTKELIWHEEELKDGEIYLIVENPEVIETLRTKAETFFNKQIIALQKIEKEKEKMEEELRSQGIANRSFEEFEGEADDGKLDIFPGWNMGGFLKPEAVTNSQDGKYAIKLTQREKTPWYDAPDLKAITQICSDSSYAGRILRISFYCKGENIDSNGAVVFYDGTENAFWSDRKKEFPITSNWQKVEFIQTIFKESKGLMVALFPNIRESSSNIVYFDNVQIRDITEEVKQRKEEILSSISPDSMVIGTPICGYGQTDAELWNPKNEQYNAIEFWEREGTTELGIRWDIFIPEGKENTPYQFTWFGNLYGAPIIFQILDATGKIIEERNLGTMWPGAKEMRQEKNLVFPDSGSYIIKITIRPEQPVEHGGRVAKAAYLGPTKGKRL